MVLSPMKIVETANLTKSAEAHVMVGVLGTSDLKFLPQYWEPYRNALPMTEISSRQSTREARAARTQYARRAFDSVSWF